MCNICSCDECALTAISFFPSHLVGVTGSGKGMTENQSRPKNKFSKDEENGA